MGEWSCAADRGRLKERKKNCWSNIYVLGIYMPSTQMIRDVDGSVSSTVGSTPTTFTTFSQHKLYQHHQQSHTTAK